MNNLNILEQNIGISEDATILAMEELKNKDPDKSLLPICNLLLLEKYEFTIPFIQKILEKEMDFDYLKRLQKSKYYRQRSSVPKIIRSLILKLNFENSINDQINLFKNLIKNSLKDKIIEVNKEAVNTIIFLFENNCKIYTSEELFDFAVSFFYDKYVQRKLFSIEFLILIKESRFLLEQIVSDSSWRVRACAARKLNQFNLEDQEIIINGLLSDEVDEVRHGLCMHLKGIKYIKFVEDSNEYVRAEYLKNNINLINNQAIFDTLARDESWMVKNTLLKLNDFWFEKIALPVLENMESIKWRDLLDVLILLEERTNDLKVSKLLSLPLINKLKGKNNEIRLKSAKILVKIIRNFDFFEEYENQLLEIINSNNYRHRMAVISVAIEYDKKYGKFISENLKSDKIDVVQMAFQEYFSTGEITGNFIANNKLENILGKQLKMSDIKEI